MTTSQIIELVVVLVLTLVGGFFIVKKSKKYDLAKWVMLFIFVAMSFTWIFSGGEFSGGNYNDYGLVQQGITDIPNIAYWAIRLAGEKIIFLLALGAFYAVLSRSEGYKKLVTNIASKFKGKEIIFTIITSLLLTAMTSMLSQTFIVLVFVPFIISIALNMKLDKISAFAVSFGSVLIGTLGAIYGTEGVYWFNYYTGLSSTSAVLYRLIILVVGFILFNLILILHIKKVLENGKTNELEADPYKIENVDKKAKTWPTIVIFSLLFVFVILGYLNWKGLFNITAFEDFHKWLLALKINDFAIFKAILGTQVADAANGAFGAWNLYIGSVVLTVFSILVALTSRIKFNDFIEAYGDGFKKISKCILVYAGIYMILVIAEMSPFMSNITNTMYTNVKSFSPYLVSLSAFISNIFHLDLGFTGYSVASFLASTYASNINVIHTIFVTMYGFTGLLLPTSGMLMIGLSYLNIEYKSWIKYIWIFIVAMLVILLILYSIMTFA